MTVGADFVPQAKMAPAGVLLLRAGDKQNESLCDAFNQLPEMGQLTDVEPDHIIPTFWLLKYIAADLRSCETLISSYDYDRAFETRVKYGVNDVKGPVLLLVQSDGRYVGIDMSSYTPPQVQTVMKTYFSLVVDEGVELQPAPAAAVKLVVAKPSHPAPSVAAASAGASAVPTPPSAPAAKKASIGKLLCTLTSKLKDTSTPLDLVGNVGSIFCPKAKPVPPA